jgi:hypothetical protein
MLMEIAPHIRGLLTPAQGRKLPSQVINILDHRYLLSIRNGTGTYVGGSTFAGPAFSMGEFFTFGGAEVRIAR